MYNDTPLFNSCNNGNKELIEYLMELGGACVYYEKVNGQTPSFIVCMKCWK